MYKFFFVLFLSGTFANASDPYPKNPAIDVINYVFQLEVNDSTDVIAGMASISINFRKSISEFELDLIGKDASGKGMEVQGITSGGKSLTFSHKNNRIKIQLPATTAGATLTFEIQYRGIPQDGLTITRNKYGDRGFFGDNWPDRGRNWLPVVDHPSDKAAVDFKIIAPMHYSVVANGIKMEESPLDYKRKLTHWHEEVAIPVKVMVIGIARFAIQHSGQVGNIPVESWVFPQNRMDGFHDYAVAAEVLDYFQRHIGEYPFKKLANVQSKTRWGGLENANTIFYFENSVTGIKNIESLIAHEEAHQWFGNSATESDWHHVWLSEGFATYFANLYLENKYGHSRLAEEEITDREEVIAYYLKNPSPVVDTTITDISKVLSTNTYQKGSWVLHMLRHKIGDDDFWKGIRQYYATYRNGNALTADFQHVMEAVSGKDLNIFFTQWIYQAGHPKISGTWAYDKKRGEVIVNLNQIQKGGLFKFELDLRLDGADGNTQVQTIQITDKSQKITIPVALAPKNVVLDPETRLLFEGALTQK